MNLRQRARVSHQSCQRRGLRLAGGKGRIPQQIEKVFRLMPQERNYDAVVFDLLTALIDSWSLWNRAAGSAEDGLRWRREYLALTYAAGPYRPYTDIVRQAARQADIKPLCAD